jgi:polyhydroxyalkanoate synthesis regulator phasin
MTVDHAGQLITELLRDLAAARHDLEAEIARRVRAETDREAYREVAQAAIEQIHALSHRLDQAERSLRAARAAERAATSRRAA